VEADSRRSKWRFRLDRWWRTVRGVRTVSVSFDEKGLTVNEVWQDGSTEKTTVKWSDVNGAVAYKRDIYAVDLICIGLTTADSAIEIHEQMRGWDEAIEALSIFLPGILPLDEWWSKAAQPPFAANPTILFSRPS